MLLHDVQELDNDLGRRTDHNLTATRLLGIVHGVERIVEDGSADHFDGVFKESRFSNRVQKRNEVSKDEGKIRISPWSTPPPFTAVGRREISNLIKSATSSLRAQRVPPFSMKGSSARAVMRDERSVSFCSPWPLGQANRTSFCWKIDAKAKGSK